MTYVLLAGAGGDAWYWSRVAPLLRERGHEVLAVDLPGDDDSAGLPEYASTVVDAIGQRTDVVLVAQSLAGFTAPLVCEQVPVALLVFVNAMIPRPGETPGEWWANTGQDAARRANDVREGRPADGGFDPWTYFLHDVPADVAEESGGHVRPQSDTPFGSRWAADAWPDVALRVVAGRDDRFFPVGFQQQVARERLGLEADVIPGGHLVALSRPQALVDALEACRAAAL